jgi:hypothetical protein
MKAFYCFLIVIVSLSVQAQRKDNQLGLRVGEPMGITFKRFVSEKTALEFIAGTASKEWSADYYRISFPRYDEFKGYTYRNHKVGDVYYLQARFLVQKPINIEGIPGAFDWFWGIGLIGKRAEVEYRFIDEFRDSGSMKIIDYDFGQESIIGLEYTLEQIPLSMFVEFSLSFEFYNHFPSFRGYSGIGLRLHF